MKTTLIALLGIIFTLPAFACSCYPRFETKTYQEIKKTMLGKRVKYTCQYECRSNGKTEIVTGHHLKRLYGEEAGNELVCDGTVYREQYSNARGWFIWVYERSEWFNPKKSNSETLKEWARNNCR